jgi:hypothetical protein
LLRPIRVVRDVAEVVHQAGHDAPFVIRGHRQRELIVGQFEQPPPRAVVCNQAMQISEIENASRILRDGERLRTRFMHLRGINGDQRKTTFGARAEREQRERPQRRTRPNRAAYAGTRRG